MRGESHKDQRKGPWILQLYYHNRIVLGGLCLVNELFYIFAYMNAFFPVIALPPALEGPTGGRLWWWLAVLCFPGFALKQIINAIQLWRAAYSIVEHEFEQDFQRKN